MSKRIRSGQIVLKGMDKVMLNLNKEFQKLKVKSTKGLIEAAIIVHRDMENTPPLIPLDLGNLRASWFSVIKRGDTAAPGVWKGKEAGKMKGEHSISISKFKTVVSGIKDPSMIMGFSANYAIYVHERIRGASWGEKMSVLDVKWSKEGSGAKFFEQALNRNEKAILLVLAANTKIK